jgi:uncharacterized alkaline shock family protein YloU
MSSTQSYDPKKSMMGDTSSPLGDININYEVIADIVRLSALQVAGVKGVGSRRVQKFQTVFSRKKEVIDGVLIEQEGDSYAVRVRVQMAFGVDLAKVVYDIQEVVRDNIQKMANLAVTRVDVIVDSIADTTSNTMEQ